jgi:hypothetical protein
MVDNNQEKIAQRSELNSRARAPRLLFLPDKDHSVRKPQNAQLLWKTVHELLERYLEP